MIHSEYIWQSPRWPNWQYNIASLTEPLAAVSHSQAKLLARLVDLSVAFRDKFSISALSEEVINTSAIEGEAFNIASVRPAVAHRVQAKIRGLTPVERNVDGVVEMVLDATSNAHLPVTENRLFGWHAALFPSGYSGMSRVQVAGFRDDANGPMQVVSGRIDRQRVHYEAPPASNIEAELRRFLDWLNSQTQEPALIKAGIGHLWFVTLHPFDDGNGRIARAIGDLLLSRADGSSQRFYSLSAQIQRERKAYYDILERTQKGTLDVTEWLGWFLANLHAAVLQAHQTLDRVLAKARFWQQMAAVPMNERQIRVLNRLLDGFEGKLTTSKWAALAKSSTDTALRDINELVERGVLQKLAAGGRSTSYELSTGAGKITAQNADE